MKANDRPCSATGETAWLCRSFRVLSSTSPTVLAPRPVWAPAAGSRAPRSTPPETAIGPCIYCKSHKATIYLNQSGLAIKGALPRGLSRRVKDGEKRIRRVRQLLLIGPGDYGDFRSAVPAKRQEGPAEAAVDIQTVTAIVMSS